MLMFASDAISYCYLKQRSLVGVQKRLWGATPSTRRDDSREPLVGLLEADRDWGRAGGWLADVQAHPPTTAPAPGTHEDGQRFMLRPAFERRFFTNSPGLSVQGGHQGHSL